MFPHHHLFFEARWRIIKIKSKYCSGLRNFHLNQRAKDEDSIYRARIEMSNKSNKRKITVEQKTGQRPSVFERLGTKQDQRDHNSSGFCRHWKNTGTCPFGSSCKNAMHHTLISPSKQRAASKDKEHSRGIKSQSGSSSRNSVGRLLAALAAAKGKEHRDGQWEEEVNELEHADETELERRRQQLQIELDQQMKKEMRRQKLAATGGSSSKKAARSSSSSSSSSSGSSSSSSGSSSDGSSSSRGHINKNKKHQSKKSKESSKSNKDAKKGGTKESPKKRSSGTANKNSSSKNRQQTAVASKRKRESSSPDSSDGEKRKQNRGQRQSSSSRNRARSATPERKQHQDKKRPTAAYEKSNKRKDFSPSQHKSQSQQQRQPRKRSLTPQPRPRRRSPTPPAVHNRNIKRHGSNSRNASPAVPRRRSPSIERKESRRGHTPPSPPQERGYNQRGRGSRRSSPEQQHRGQQSREGKQRAPPGREPRQSPDRRPPPIRASSREPVENKRADWSRGREFSGNSPPPPRSHHRASPEGSNGNVHRNRDTRGEKMRAKEPDRDRRRDGAMEKVRDKSRRTEDGDLPSLLTLMTQHPGPSSNRNRPLNEPPFEHRSRDRGRYERYENDRADPVYSDHPEDHHRGGPNKRGPAPPRRDQSPTLRQQRTQKRDWNEFPDTRNRDWERRPGSKSNAPMRQWGPTPGSEDQPRHNRMLPPLSVRNAMQAACRNGASPNNSPQQNAAPNSPADSVLKTSADSKINEPVEIPEKEIEDLPHPKESSGKRSHEVSSDGEEGEPPNKRQCITEQDSPPQPPAVAAPVSSGLDLMESDLSDISDDPDDILNAEGVEESEEPEVDEKAEGVVCEDDEEEVDDLLLDTMDFEEISDGELEAEEARGGVDALTVDWAALMSQTRSKEGEETKELRTHRWQARQLLGRLGVSMELCSPSLISKLGITVNGTEFEDNEDKIKLLDAVPGIHMALRAQKQQRECIFQLKDRRGLSAADDLAFRRQLNGFPAKKSGHKFNPSVDPELYNQAVQMLLAN